MQLPGHRNHDTIGDRNGDRLATTTRPQHLPSRVAHRLGGCLATAVLSTISALLSTSAAFAGVSANPVAPPGAAGLQDLLNWTLYGGSIACAATSMFGFAKMGISHTQQSYQGANHGKSVALLGLVGALGLGLTPTIVNGLLGVK